MMASSPGRQQGQIHYQNWSNQGFKVPPPTTDAELEKWLKRPHTWRLKGDVLQLMSLHLLQKDKWLFERPFSPTTAKKKKKHKKTSSSIIAIHTY